MTTGIHHITAIAGAAQRNYDFYAKVLGLRMVKKTVNFDDPGTYHFYFGNEQGDPGTILTFFPWEGIPPGRRGTGQVTETAFAVPRGSLEFWVNRLIEANIIYNPVAEKFGHRYLTLLDPDGLKIELAEMDADVNPFLSPGISAAEAIRGFAYATLSLSQVEPTARLLTDTLGYRLESQHVNRYRLVNDAAPYAAAIELAEVPGEARGRDAAGSVHHIAFRVSNDEEEMALREKILSLGYQITPPIDRQYFHSLYFREKGGVLFEIATDHPGFGIDEPWESLGQSLMLPPQYETKRAQIEQALPTLIH